MAGIEIRCKTSDTLPLHQLTQFQGGLKERNAKDISKVMRSIKKHGFVAPFFVWRHDGINHVLDGHGRLLALTEMAGSDYVIPPLPVVYVDCKNESEAKEILLKITSSYGKVTQDGFAEFIDGLDLDFQEIQLPAGVFEFAPRTTLHESGEAKEEDIPDEEPHSKRGEIYELGCHRLMCGDSTDPDDAKKLMKGETAELLFTSPPYMDLRDYDTESGADLSVSYVARFIPAFRSLARYMAVNLGLVIKKHEIIPYWNDFLENAAKSGLKMLAWNVWDKQEQMSIHAVTHSMFPLTHEWIFVFGEEPKELNRTINKKHGQQKQRARLGRNVDGSLSYHSTGDTSGTLKRLSSVQRALTAGTDGSSKHHPAAFSEEIANQYIFAMTNPDDIVIDCFGGGGTTLISCAKTHRRARLMEISPRYCDVIRRRWTKFAKLNGLPVGKGGLE